MTTNRLLSLISSSLLLCPASALAQQEAGQIQEIIVTGDASTNYYHSSASGGTKTNTPIFETPVSIQLIPQQLLKDTQTLSLTDAVNGKVSGVLGRTGGGHLYDNFIIRGLPGSDFGDAFRNGLFNRADIYDVTNIEQVEIVKGPAAVLYGRIEPGGLVNYVTKKPQEESSYSVQQQFGSYHQQRTSLDVTGPLTDDSSLLYRVNASYTDNESFRNFVGNERTFVSPVIRWRPNTQFEATVELEYKKDLLHYDLGIPAVGNRPAPIPLDRSMADDNQRAEMESTLLSFDWTYRFDDDWKVTQRYLHKDWSLAYNQLLNMGLDADNRTLDRAILKSSSDPFRQTGYATNLDLNGQFEFGLTEHNLLIGIDLFNSIDTGRTLFGFTTPIDIYEPVYGQLDFSTFPAETEATSFYRREKWHGVYVQDQITLLDSWHLLLGGRYDSVDSGSNGGPAGSRISEAKDGYSPLKDYHFSPRLGLLYEATDWLSLYGSYTESFGPNNGVSANGESFEPQVGEQVEFGIKLQTLDQRFAATLAAFDIVQSNLLTDDPSTIDPNIRILAGEINSRGVELDVSGEINEQVKLLATYAYTDATYTDNNDGLQGNRLQNVPLHQGSLWGVWQFSEALEFGLGAVAVDAREGDPQNSVQLPGYGRFDALLRYNFRLSGKQINLQLNVYNLFDKEYFTNTGGNRNQNMPGSPLTAMGSISIQL